MKVPLEVQATGMKLWGYVDDEGRAELRPDLIAAHVAPGRDVMQTVEEHLVALDDAVDAMFQKIKHELVELIVQSRDEADQAIDLIIITKYLERIADHAVNIAQWAMYCVTGELAQKT